MKQAFLLGIYQTIAMIPGVSRSGAIIVGGLFMKMERKLLTEFTFYSLFLLCQQQPSTRSTKNHEVVMQTGNISLLLTGALTSFIVATLVIKLFLDYIKRHTFVFFGIYRIIF